MQFRLRKKHALEILEALFADMHALRRFSKFFIVKRGIWDYINQTGCQ
jgi:hypothetical protein